jgi:DNA-binding GntR family transcriptional regulator
MQSRSHRAQKGTKPLARLDATEVQTMKKNAATQLRDAIENDILTGALVPGERLDEVSLANRFGVSRTPVREALAQLDSVGLIELRPNRGAIVAQVGAGQLVEMFEVMAELEGLAVRLATRRGSQIDRKAIATAQEECRRAAERGDTDAYYYENERFHQAIYTASRNGFLIDQCVNLQRRLRPYRRLQLRASNRVRTSVQEHDAVVEAIAAGDSKRAEEALKQHIIIQGERFGDLVALLADTDRVA